jgi:5-methyltetrahydrofolate--homocysteine methyltransferase
MNSKNEVMLKLQNTIINLDAEAVKRVCQEALAAGIPAYSLILDGMAKGMEIVGQKYENGEYFLAELLMAGEAMKAGISLLEPHLKAEETESAGKIVLGTVRGDIHDIGKNVLTILLKAANFEVVDLGTDVPAEEFVKAVQKHLPDIVGMSAMLTSSMTEMKTTINELANAGLRDKVKIIVGGASVTPEYARKIGADAGINDAVEGVRICSRWIKPRPCTPRSDFDRTSGT